MFNNPYINNYNQQQTLDRINDQIKQLENIRNQMQQPIQQPTPINLTQNFQPTTRETIKYANSLEEVEREVINGETPFFSKDMGVVWLKNAKGEIKTYELNEIIPKDEKDMQIDFLKEQQQEKDKRIDLLQAQISELKGMINNDANVTNVITTENTTNTEWNDDKPRTAVKSTQSTGIQRVSTSKKK